MSFPNLESIRLTLDEITHSDSLAIFELFSNPEVVKYYDVDAFSDITQAKDLIDLFCSRYKTSTGIRWAIRMKDASQLIGTCGFNSWSTKMRNGTIGYDLKPAYWNRGIVTEAIGEIIGTAFAGLLPCGPLHRIQAETIPGNLASERVLLKLGFQQEGIRRGSAYLRGEFHDMKCFGLLKHEYSPQNLQRPV